MILWDSVADHQPRRLHAPADLGRRVDRLSVACSFLSIAAIWAAFRDACARKQEATGEQLPVLWVSLGLLILPALLAYFVLGRPVTLERPELGGFNFVGRHQVRNSFIALWLALSLYTGGLHRRERARRHPGRLEAGRPRPPSRWACARTGRCSL
jgi:general L-amino acid transport system permease protein